MFLDIPQAVQDRMIALEQIDTRDRTDGTPRTQRLRQIPPETGKFVALMAASVPAGQYIEIGTSGGYSTLWLALACRQLGRKLTTFEVLEEKVMLARETFRLAEVEDVVALVHGDARKYLQNHSDIAFCFLDAEKEIYAGCYEALVPKIISGGLLVADNAINWRKVLEPMLNRAQSDPRVDSMLVPVGKGVLVCRRK